MANTNKNDNMSNIINKINKNDENTINDDTIVITKIVLDFDDALFPSHCYKEHEILKYHESTSSDVQTGRDLFKKKEPKFITLKKNIDLVIFKLMQLYEKDNFVLLSTGDYQWIESTLKYYNYLLYAYNITIYSTQEWHKKHPNDFNINSSLDAKTFLMKMLLNKWKTEANKLYKSSGKKIKFRLISIGDSFFEFLSCYNIGFDYVNRIKLLEEPSVTQMINLWNKILYLCQDNIYNSNVVFITDNEYYYLNNERMMELNIQCINTLNNINNDTARPLLHIITHKNSQCYEINMDKNGKQYKKKKLKTQLQTDSMNNNNNNINNDNDNDNVYNYDYNIFIPVSQSPESTINNQFFYTQQHYFYAQQLLQQQQQIQSQFIFHVPLPQYTNFDYYSDQYNAYNTYNCNVTNTILTSNYASNT